MVGREGFDGFEDDFDVRIVESIDMRGTVEIGVDDEIEVIDDGDEIIHPGDVGIRIEFWFEDVETGWESNGVHKNEDNNDKREIISNK